MDREVSTDEKRILVIVKALENIISKEDTQEEKRKLAELKEKISNTKSTKFLEALKQYQVTWVKLFLDHLSSWQDSFQQLTDRPQYAKGKSIDIFKHFLSIIPEVGLTKDSLTRDNFNVKLYLKSSKFVKAEITKDFPGRWMQLAKEIQDQKKKRESQAAAERQREKQLHALQQRERQSERRKQKEEQRRREEVERRQRQHAKQTERIRQADRQELERQRERSRREQQRRSGVRSREKEREQTKSRWTALERYLQHRRDIHVDKGKNKQMAEYLATRLEHFLKVTLQKVYDFACVKNKKSSLGNQFGYFPQGSERVPIEAPFYIQPSSKIYALSYKSKLEGYFQLRVREFAKEDSLQEQLEAKAGHSDRKLDRKLENYLFKPRHVEVKEWEEEKVDLPVTSAVHISFEHFIEYLEQHHYLRNSLVLFNAYHN